jgi:hypothetical protein
LRLVKSHDYWVATVWPDGRPHVMPVWGVWRDEAVWFSSSLGSRKARNLAAGVATRVADRGAIAAMLAAVNEKYDAHLDADFLDPAVNATFRVGSRWAFGLDEKDFSGSPTRWRFSFLG